MATLPDKQSRFLTQNSVRLTITAARMAVIALMIPAGLLSLSALAQPVAQQVNVRWDALNLSTDQSTHMHDIEDQWQNTASNLIPQINQDKDELMKLLNSSNGDSARVLELQNRIAENKGKLQKAAMQAFLKKREELDANQRQMLQLQMNH